MTSIVLVTGAGGTVGGILRPSGVGQALAGSLEWIGLPPIVAAFVISIAPRVAQGSDTTLSHFDDSGFWLVGWWLL